MKRLIFDKESICFSQTPENIQVEQRLTVFLLSGNVIWGRDPWNPSTSKTLMPYSQTDTCVTSGRRRRRRKKTLHHQQVVGRDMRRERSAGYWGRGQNKSLDQKHAWEVPLTASTVKMSQFYFCQPKKFRVSVAWRTYHPEGKERPSTNNTNFKYVPEIKWGSYWAC